MKEIVKTAAVLLIIAALAGLILGGVSIFTKIDEAEVLAQNLSKVYACQEGYDDVSNQVELTVENGGIDGVYLAKDLSGTVIVKSYGKGGYGGNIVLLTAFCENTVTNITVYEAKETPGLGSKALEEKYLKQYFGADLTTVEAFVLAGRDHSGEGGIDAVTGATKSSSAVLRAVNAALKAYRVYTGGAAV